MPIPPAVPVAHLPVTGELTPGQWARVERLLDEWKAEVLAAARRHPARSYRLGVAQTEAFAKLITEIPGAAPLQSMFGGHGPTARAAEAWQRTYTLHELDDALNRYIGQVKDALLYGLRHTVNPTEVASWLYNATRDATVNWRTIARTEMVRANAAGRLHAAKQMGFQQVWVPPHVGACPACKRLLENKVFRIDELLEATNYGRPESEWVATIPLHPQCRHHYLPYVPEIYDAAMSHYRDLEAAGLTDVDRLEELYDSSGQLRPGMSLSPAEQDATTWKTFDPYMEGLAAVVHRLRHPATTVAKRARRPRREWIATDELRSDTYQRPLDADKVLGMHRVLRAGGTLPPPRVSRRSDGSSWVYDGQHRVEARRLHGDPVIDCHVTYGLDWDQEADRCREAIAKLWDPLHPDMAYMQGGQPRVRKVAIPESIEEVLSPAPEPQPELGNTQPALDPLLFDGLRLRDDVALALEAWWTRVAGDGWADTPDGWAWLLMPAYSRVPVVVVDYDRLRAARPDWASMTDADLHFALIAASAAHRGRELAPGLPLDVRIVPVHLDTNPSGDRQLRQVVDAVRDFIGPEPVWSPESSFWLGGVPPGEPVDAAKVIGAYTWADDPSQLGPSRPRPNFQPLDLALADRLVDGSELVAKTVTVGWHVAPAAARAAIEEHGLLESQPNDRWQRYGAAVEPAGIYIWTDRRHALEWATNMARLVGNTPLARNDVWRVDLTGLPQHRDPVLGDQGAIYLALPSIPPSRLTLEVTKTTGELAVDVAKAAAAPPADVGAEHWITIHPHGDEDQGQPVLVHNNPDGTMTVVGGAGGNLNYLRLDPKRRIDTPEKASGSRVEQHVSAAEAEASQAQREQEVQRATEHLRRATEARQTALGSYHSYLGDVLGQDLTRMDTRQRSKLLKDVRNSAVRTLAYGPMQKRDANQGATRENLGLDKPGAPQPWDDTDRPTGTNGDTADTANGDEPGRQPRPKVALTEEEARNVLGHLDDLRGLSRIAGEQRKVIGGDTHGSDALQIDWTLGGPDAKAERVARQVEQQVRTDLARQLVSWGNGETGKVPHQLRFQQAVQQGGYDAIDSFSYSVLGRSVLTREAHDLLGIAGSAQLVAHAIQQQADKAGKKGLDLGKVGQALDELRGEQEAAIVERGLARAQHATKEAAEAALERTGAEQGKPSMYTTTMAKSLQASKLQEAGRALGMMTSGLEAASALRAGLERRAGDRIKVGGFKTPSQILQLAEKAHVHVTPANIVRAGAGNYTLQIEPEKLEGLLRPQPPGNSALRERLQGIRTAADLDQAVQEMRHTPGMSDTLDANQARGKAWLLAAGSGILGFDPGVGKTHTAVAAAMHRMHTEPDAHHKALIVCPANMVRTWQRTIADQGSGHSVSAVGVHDTDPGRDQGDRRKRVQQLTRGADFTIVPYESLAAYRKHLGELGHSMVIADELQKAKDETKGAFAAVDQAVDAARDQHGDNAAFMGLTGTAIEKKVGDLQSMVKLSMKAKGQQAPERGEWDRRYGKLGQDEHIARSDRIRQFRQGLDEHLYRLTAAQSGNQLADPGRQTHHVTLDPEHRKALEAKVAGLNDQIAQAQETRAQGGQADGPAFGGRAALLGALYKPDDVEHNALARQAAEIVAGLGTHEFKGMAEPDSDSAQYQAGDHAGTYAHKAVIFGHEVQPLMQVRHHLEKAGIKVFEGHGGVTNAQNDANMKAFLAHPDKAVFLTSDKNNAGVSLQFGDNKGRFQHGATHMIHFTRPENNAKIQQREARILRKGAQASFDHDGHQVPVVYHQITADTPVERKISDLLDRERRTQDLVGNSDQTVSVAGEQETRPLAHLLEQRGISPEKRP